MAYVKTFPIRYHVKTSIEYIAAPHKTDNGNLVSCYNCSLETADLEFKQTRRLSGSKGKQAARHIVQSFKYGEVTPEQAHEIGRRFADEVLQGKYEYVIATHINSSAIHNHIIFNSVSFEDHRRYRSNKHTYKRMKFISDDLCREYGLSVIDENNNSRKRSQSEIYSEQRSKRVVWRDILRADIDKVIQEANGFDDFLNQMYKLGYGIKTGKYLAFKNKAQQRYMRVKSLGADYTEDEIKERIITKRQPIPKRIRNSGRDITLLIQIESNIKCRTSAAYENWAKLNNLKEAAKTLNFLIEHDISSFKELDSKADTLKKQQRSMVAELKQLNDDVKDIDERIYFIKTYEEYKPIAAEYEKAILKSKFRQKHFDELELFETVHARLKQLYPNKKIPSVAALKRAQERIELKKDELYKQYKDAQNEAQTYSMLRENIQRFLGLERAAERHTRSKEQSIE